MTVLRAVGFAMLLLPAVLLVAYVGWDLLLRDAPWWCWGLLLWVAVACLLVGIA